MAMISKLYAKGMQFKPTCGLLDMWNMLEQKNFENWFDRKKEIYTFKTINKVIQSINNKRTISLKNYTNQRLSES